MTEKELFDKNLELASELSRYVLAHPELKLPAESEIFFLVDSDPELTQANIKLAKSLKQSGEKVVFIHIKTLLPKETSRLVEPKVEMSAR